jgi:hypothetical protein
VPSFATGVVTTVLAERPGLQRVEVDLGAGPERAYVLTGLTPPVAPGDEVVVNTTAVELGLGTGGWHVVHWNLARRRWRRPGPGHVLKLRYTSLQTDVGSAEEHLPAGADAAATLDGLPVVALALHSQLAAAAVAAADTGAGRVVYVMTDGAALPAALSDLVADLRRRDLLAGVVTAGHAFGGDVEAVSLPSALWLARHVLGAQLALVAMGPGIVGTGSTLGTTGAEVAAVLDAAAALGGRPVAALRASAADPRDRHRGVSHHTLTVLGRLCRSRVTVPVPARDAAEAAELLTALKHAGVTTRHDVRLLPPVGIVARLRARGVQVTSMGRPAEADPLLFEAAAVAVIAATDPGVPGGDGAEGIAGPVACEDARRPARPSGPPEEERRP